jgi:hypothetical protein
MQGENDSAVARLAAVGEAGPPGGSRRGTNLPPRRLLSETPAALQDRIRLRYMAWGWLVSNGPSEDATESFHAPQDRARAAPRPHDVASGIARDVIALVLLRHVITPVRCEVPAAA